MQGVGELGQAERTPPPGSQKVWWEGPWQRLPVKEEGALVVAEGSWQSLRSPDFSTPSPTSQVPLSSRQIGERTTWREPCGGPLCPRGQVSKVGQDIGAAVASVGHRDARGRNSRARPWADVRRACSLQVGQVGLHGDWPRWDWPELLNPEGTE